MIYLLFMMSPLPPALVQAIFAAQASAEAPQRTWWLWVILLVICSLAVAWLLQRESAPVKEDVVQTMSSATPEVGETRFVAGEPSSAPVTAAPDEQKTTPTAPAEISPLPVASRPADITKSQPSDAPVAVDDLTAIEGIGPKIKGILQDAHVLTYSDLAQAEVDDLKQILLNAGLRVNNPATWPAQAALAAEGKWDELKAMQSQLKAGRRN